MIVLVMLVIPDAFDVVPGRGLMAAITLIHLNGAAASGYLRIFLSGDLFRNHFKVHHVMARRRLMTLRARLRGGRRVMEFGDCPLRRRVA